MSAVGLNIPLNVSAAVLPPMHMPISVEMHVEVSSQNPLQVAEPMDESDEGVRALQMALGPEIELPAATAAFRPTSE